MNQPFTPSQLRAARALLDWSRADLAKHTGVSEPTIHRLENGIGKAEAKTQAKIRRTIENKGVEFTDNEGVRFKPSNITIYDGIEAFEKFHEFLYFHLKEIGGDVCLSIYDEPALAKYRKDPEIHRGRMRELYGNENAKSKGQFRILTTKSTWNTRGYITFRWMPNQRPSPTGFYAFGDCLALVSFVNPLSPYTVVLQSGPITEAYRQGFNIAWEHAKLPPKSKL